MTGARRGIPESAWGAALLVVGTSVLAAGWRDWSAFAMLLGAALLPLVLVPLMARLRVSPVTTATLLVLGGVALVSLVGVAPDGSRLTALVDAVPRLLTSPSPAATRADLVAPGALLALLAGTVVALRRQAARRHRVTPVVAALVLYAAGLALTAGAADRVGLAGLLIALLAVGGWVLLGRTAAEPPGATPIPAASATATGSAPGSAPGGRRLVSAVWPVLALVGTVVLAGSIPSRAGAFDPRRYVTPPVDSIVAQSPLPRLAAWGRDTERELFRVEGEAVPLRLAVLTRFSGATWDTPSRFRPVGAADEPALPPGATQRAVTSRVTLIDVPAPWAPSPGAPVTCDDGSAMVDAAGGSLILTRQDPIASYQVTGRTDVADAAALAAASPSRPDLADDLAPYLEVPRLPQSFIEYAKSATRGARTPAEQAAAIEAAVRGGRTVNPKAPSGSSYVRLEEFLFGDPAIDPGGRVGTSEQFATAFAVIARESGLPTRIVVGFRPGTPGADGVRVVRGRDALAWPEVYFVGVGWVPFAPTPDTDLGTPLQDRPPAVPQQTPSPSSSEPVPKQPPPVAATGGSGGTGELSPVVWWGAALALAVLVPVLLLYAARARRRARLRAAGATGAWGHLLDVAALAGLQVAASQEARGLADALDARAGRPAPGGGEAADGGGAAAVVRAAEAAAFAPGASASSSSAAGSAPASSAPASAAPAGEHPSWSAAVAVERSLRGRATLVRRIWWALDPRPLWRPAGRPLAGARGIHTQWGDRHDGAGSPETGRNLPAERPLASVGGIRETGRT